MKFCYWTLYLNNREYKNTRRTSSCSSKTEIQRVRQHQSSIRKLVDVGASKGVDHGPDPFEFDDLTCRPLGVHRDRDTPERSNRRSPSRFPCTRFFSVRLRYEENTESEPPVSGNDESLRNLRSEIPTGHKFPSPWSKRKNFPLYGLLEIVQNCLNWYTTLSKE